VDLEDEAEIMCASKDHENDNDLQCGFGKNFAGTDGWQFLALYSFDRMRETGLVEVAAQSRKVAPAYEKERPKSLATSPTGQSSINAEVARLAQALNVASATRKLTRVLCFKLDRD
jgi:hypothetical protein